MLMRVRWLLLAGMFACAGHHTPLVPAGAEGDDGHGELAQASRQLITAEEGSEPDPFAEDRGSPRDRRDGAYGGSTYATFNPPTWPALSIDREPPHEQIEDAKGVIEGTVTWRGAIPPPLTTRCGPLPSIRVGTNHALGGALVFVERVERGRVVPMDTRPSTVGGSIAKRGCAFLPAAQIVAPLPAALVVHGDDKAVRVRIGTKDPVELQAGGRVALQAPTGITRVDAEDGTHAAAWVVGTESPVYAITDDGGRYRLDELAPGTYEVTFWHPPLPSLSNGTLAYGAPIVTKRSVRVGARPARLDATLAR